MPVKNDSSSAGLGVGSARVSSQPCTLQAGRLSGKTQASIRSETWEGTYSARSLPSGAVSSSGNDRATDGLGVRLGRSMRSTGLVGPQDHRACLDVAQWSRTVRLGVVIGLGADLSSRPFRSRTPPAETLSAAALNNWR